MTNVVRSQFDHAYDQLVVGRTFVEYKDYYHAARQRFWLSFDAIQQLELPKRARVLDIGGGILATLLSGLLGHDASVCDVHEAARADIESVGLSFQLADVYRDLLPKIEDADLVVFTEVIEHLPLPPYVILERLARLLKPGGYLFVTTPNGHRFRNVVRMVAGREILDFYRLPEEGQGLGHQHEYTRQQLLWQADAARLEVVRADYYEDGFLGASTKAKIGRWLARPTTLVPRWRNGIMMVLRTRQDETFRP